MKPAKRIAAAALAAVLTLTLLTACSGDLGGPAASQPSSRPDQSTGSPAETPDDTADSASGTPAGGDSGPDSTETADARLTAYRQEVLRLVNVERAKVGAAPLTMNNPRLNSAAQKRATELLSLFSHTRPDGRSCSTVLADYGVDWWTCGENIASGYNANATPQEVVNGWMNSPGHRANILNENFTEIGIGYTPDSSGHKHYWVQVFIG